MSYPDNNRRVAPGYRDRRNGQDDSGEHYRDIRQGSGSIRDIDTLLLDKTGTITLGNRQAVAFIPAHGFSEEYLADVAQFASLSDETPEAAVLLSWQRKSTTFATACS